MRLGARDLGSTLLVSALSSLFASGLILLTGIMNAAMPPDLAANGNFRLVLLMVSSIFILLALYVGAIVTANAFSTVIAGRTRIIALFRLIGATSGSVRSRIARDGLLAGLIGAIIGLAVATVLAALAGLVGPALGWLPEGVSYPFFDPLTIVAVLLVALTTWVAAWAGSKRVGRVSPIAATGAAVEAPASESRRRPARTVFAILFIVSGFALLALGVLVGFVSPLGLFIAFCGGLGSFTGIALGDHLVMPPILGLAALPFRSSATGRVATENARRHPERSSRSTIGLVVGVTLVVMFAVAMQSFERMAMIGAENDPTTRAVVESTFQITTAIFSALTGFSAIIAAVGLVNTLSLNVLQRTRELGLLRTLGFTGGQVRAMVLIESAQMTLAAVGLGLVLGVFYGWVAAQSLLGSTAGLVPPSIPWLVVAVVALFGIVLALGAAAAPARRAIRVPPVAALAVE